jgi:hypothetical protein
MKGAAGRFLPLEAGQSRQPDSILTIYFYFSNFNLLESRLLCFFLLFHELHAIPAAGLGLLVFLAGLLSSCHHLIRLFAAPSCQPRRCKPGSFLAVFAPACLGAPHYLSFRRKGIGDLVNHWLSAGWKIQIGIDTIKYNENINK